ncbi:HAD family hydrolase [Thioclava atlantica]|uniref:HAD superfamily hydrolase n=1 Tax=Thioclava atlantica TaxID=1317124 RepID=A0A085TSK0_9RHOB|nr:HAD family hydrolase [Thioclava atlantica]KFE33697.1 HAD superfamily hydrolase [Thioclava atlantica]
MRLTTIGFDADDTLWHNERFFQLTQARFTELMAEHAGPDHLSDRLIAAETRNIAHYGFGVKGFTLSMIETAIEVSEGRVPATVLAEILSAGREMLSHPIELLPHAREVIEQLSDRHRIVLVTKGDLIDQERKLAQSGLGDLFDAVEIVSDKRPDTYMEVFARHGSGPEEGLMAGNSLKSDVIPMIEAGGWGVHVPHELTWAFEHAEPPRDHPRFAELPDLGGLPHFIARIEG